MVDHLGHLTLSSTQSLSHNTDKFIGNINNNLLDWLHLLAVDVTNDDLGFRDLQFVTFASHHFDQNRQLKFSATGHPELIRRTSLFNSDCYIGKQFPI